MVVAGVGAWWVMTQVGAAELGRRWPAILAVVVLGILAEWWPLEAPLRRSTLSANLYEAALIVALILLPPPAVPLAVAIGIAISLTFRKIGISKWGFNVAMHLVSATAAAAGIHATTGGPIDPTSPQGAAWLIAAGLVYGVVNIAAMIGVLHLLRDQDGRVVNFRTFFLEAGYGALISISLGVVVAVVMTAAPWVLPLAVVPIVMVRWVLAGGTHRMAAETAERERMSRTIAGASEGICLLDRRGAIELLNPAAVRMLGTASTEVAGRLLDDLLTADPTEQPIAAALGSASPDEPRQPFDLPVADRILRVEVTGLFERGRLGGAVVMLFDVTEAREQESLRQELLGRVSHELRTPLTAIVGFAETLHTHADDLDVAHRRGYLEVIQRQGHRLGRLVDDLLWSSRVEAGKVQVQPDVVRLRDIVVDVEAGLRPVLRGVTLRWDIEDVTVYADARHVEQVLNNLITNAVTYGASPVTITARTDQDRAVIEVIDAGAGVRPSFVPQLFTAFEQESKGDRREARGLGLGLAIVAALLEQNGGTIEYLRSPGRTVFQVTLPAR